MEPDARDEIHALAEQVRKPCTFVLEGYAQPYPCLKDAHDPDQAHDCGGIAVVAQSWPAA